MNCIVNFSVFSANSVVFEIESCHEMCLNLCRKYETVEQQTKIIEGDSYVAVPESNELADAVVKRLGLTSREQKVCGIVHI